MRYHVLATDYDGTLATDGQVGERTVEALRSVRGSGRHLVLVTGRRVEDLEAVFQHVALFERIVAENGAVVWRPGAEQRLLADPLPAAFPAALRARGVPFVAGRVVVATWLPYDVEVLGAIRALGLDLEIIFNKGAVMVLPPGVDKRSGLEAALGEIGRTLHETVAIGDAENDQAMLAASGCGVAVSNALPVVKETADVVTLGARGAGVEEIAAALLRDDLGSHGASGRHG
jgi:hypothetical protein